MLLWNFRVYIGNCMDSSRFPDLWAWLMFRKLSNLHEPWASANLKTLETSLVPINHEKHEQVDTMFYLSYTQQLIHHTSLHSLRLCSQVLFKAFKNIMLPHVKSGVKFLKVSQKNICLHSWAEKWRHFVQMFVLVFFKFWFFFSFIRPCFPDIQPVCADFKVFLFLHFL